MHKHKHTHRCHALNIHTYKHMCTQEENMVSHVRLVLAGPVKCCCAAQWVFDRRSSETASGGFSVRKSLTSTLANYSFCFPLFLYFSVALPLLPHCHAPLSNLFSLPVSRLFSDIRHFPLFALLLLLLPPSAELREGWYSNDRVALFESLPSIPFLPLNCHLCLRVPAVLCAVLMV